MSQFYFGVDYYPEQWDESRWAHDAARMRAAGFNVVRLAEFAWGVLEPADGQFRFEWLDRAMAILHAAGLQVVLGTPAASMPSWMAAAYPDMAIVDADGRARTFGSRRDASPAHPRYRDYALRIARAMAQHYAAHPAVIGWQIDNEFGDRCYSDHARRRFQDWLRTKYHTLEALNAAWGTVFWSHTYHEWSHIPVPRSTTHACPNPGLHLDYYRFLSDLYVEFQQAHIDVLRMYIPPQHFITHNCMGFTYSLLNYFALARPLDLVSWDNYPIAFWREPAQMSPAAIALGHAAMWGLKRRNFWVMEQQSGPSGWHIISPSPQPGQLALWAYQAMAYGADGVVFFRWRTNPRAAEQNWHGLLDYDDVPRRRYFEVAHMGAQIAAVGAQIAGSIPVYPAAIIHDYDVRFSFQIQPDNRDFHYENHVLSYFAALHARGLAAVPMALHDDLSACRLVIAPALRLVDDDDAAALTRYAENGGVLVLTMRSGTRDRSNAMVTQTLPGRLAALCGVTIEETDSLPTGEFRALRWHDDSFGQGCASIWCDVLQPTDAEVWASYADCWYTQRAAITARTVGRGMVIYVGTAGDAALIATVLARASARAGLTAPLDLTGTQGVEVTERQHGTERLIFLLNHGGEPASVTLDRPMRDLLTDTALEGVIVL
nr:beta-galactosidase [Anaerolineae bacterium]